MAMATVLLALVLAVPAAFAVQYNVGDTSGWNQGVDYNDWTQGKTFNVGDTLLFSYGGSHTVDVVSKSDYDNCATGNSISSHSDGSTVIKLDKEGSMYFLCPAFGHCSSGMKLAVTVSAASTPTPSGGTPPATTTPSSSSPSTDPLTPTTTDSPPASTTPKSSTPPAPSAATSNNFNSMINLVVLVAPFVALMG